MHYGFMANDLVEVGLPTPAQVGLGMAGAEGLRLQLLEQLNLPHDDADAEGGEEGARGVMAVGEDGLVSLPLQEAVGGAEPRNEVKLLCMLRIRRMPDATLMPCAQHGSVRAAATSSPLLVFSHLSRAHFRWVSIRCVSAAQHPLWPVCQRSRRKSGRITP